MSATVLPPDMSPPVIPHSSRTDCWEPFVVSTVLRSTAIGETIALLVTGWCVFAALAWGVYLFQCPAAIVLILSALWMILRSVGGLSGFLRTVFVTSSFAIAAWRVMDSDLSLVPTWLSEGVFSPFCFAVLLSLWIGIDLVDFTRAKQASSRHGS